MHTKSTDNKAKLRGFLPVILFTSTSFADDKILDTSSSVRILSSFKELAGKGSSLLLGVVLVAKKSVVVEVPTAGSKLEVALLVMLPDCFVPASIIDVNVELKLSLLVFNDDFVVLPLSPNVRLVDEVVVILLLFA